MPLLFYRAIVHLVTEQLHTGYYVPILQVLHMYKGTYFEIHSLRIKSK
jgi:hypothetical protein